MSRKKASSRKKTRRPDAAISFWAVAFLDLLGYRSTLARFDAFPLPTDPEQANALQYAFARAVHFRRRLLGGIQQFMDGSGSAPRLDLSRLPPSLRRMGERWRKVKILHSPGPDHIVLGCSLAPRLDHFPMRAVYTLVSTVAAASLLHLMIGADDADDTLPLRGGIDVAAGELMTPEQFLYSPALTRAYDLERTQAIYPRTVVGERFVGLLSSQVSNPDADPESQYNRALAKGVASMLFKDKDGAIVVDFLGPTLRRQQSASFARSLASRAWTYARDAYSAARKRGDYKVLMKYAWLIDYMGPRLQSWGVKPR
jgi:hypothetical protein